MTTPKLILGTTECREQRRGLAAGRMMPAPFRFPAGVFHAVDAETRTPLCGTDTTLQLWPDRPYGRPAIGRHCDACEQRAAELAQGSEDGGGH